MVLTLEQIPRSQNEEADKIARIAPSGGFDPDVPLECLNVPSIQNLEVNLIEAEQVKS